MWADKLKSVFASDVQQYSVSICKFIYIHLKALKSDKPASFSQDY